MIWHSLIEPRKLVLPKLEDALAGRPERMRVPARHAVSGAALEPPFPDGAERAVFGMGCFWGAERKLWETPGVCTTAAGYAGGFTPNPTYQEVCSGQTGHTEVVLAVFHTESGELRRVAAPVLGGARPDAGACARGTTSARSTARPSYCFSDAQRQSAEASRDAYQAVLAAAGYERDQHRDPAGRRVLLRRGLPPAVSRQESVRLLRPRGYRRRLPDRLTT